MQKYRHRCNGDMGHYQGEEHVTPDGKIEQTVVHELMSYLKVIERWNQRPDAVPMRSILRRSLITLAPHFLSFTLLIAPCSVCALPNIRGRKKFPITWGEIDGFGGKPVVQDGTTVKSLFSTSAITDR